MQAGLLPDFRPLFEKHGEWPALATYGNFGGPGWGVKSHSPLRPIDSMDELFAYHDLDYTAAMITNWQVKSPARIAADKALVSGLKNLHSDPRKWARPAPNPIHAAVYRYTAIQAFTVQIGGDKK